MIKMTSDRLFIFKEGETYSDNELPRNFKDVLISHGYAEEFRERTSKPRTSRSYTHRKEDEGQEQDED